MLLQYLKCSVRFCIPLILLTSFQVCAQTVITEKTKIKKVTTGAVVTGSSEEVEVDLGQRGFKTFLPFDTPLRIKLTLTDKTFIKKDEALSVNAYYNKISLAGTPSIDYIKTIISEAAANRKGVNYQWRKAEGTRGGPEDPFHFSIGKLPPNRDFTFILEIERKLKPGETTKLREIAGEKLKSLKDKKGTFGFSIKEVDSITGMLKDSITRYMASKDLIANFKDNRDSETIKDSLQILLSLKEGTVISTDPLTRAKALLVDNFNSLNAFVKKYAKSIDGKDKKGDLALLGRLAAMKSIELKTPLVDTAFTRADMAKQKLSFDTVRIILKQMKLPGNKEFGSIKANITDALEAIGIQTENYLNNVDKAKAATTANARKIADTFAQGIIMYMTVSGTSFNPDFVTRANTYISADLGLALIPSAGKMVPYLGTNIYFRPVNRNEKITWSSNMGKRVSLLVGLSVGSIAKPNYRDDLLANSFNLITGVGFRVASFVRFNGGYLWYTKVNENPLNTNNSIAGKPFVSLSFDIDVRTVFNGLFTAGQTKILTGKE
ncbi:hypothetical protein [Pedobacter psychrodurus]|uniref:hypothetical protein n=1 Tax=Pedobacter psychrodurus TaxID=2530456 RepID=UPI0029310FA9|nr:hypothetical protein [Pedobacter psychrodurus]